MKFIINGLIFRVTIGTWNVAGILPCNDLEIEGWLCTEEPSDIYIIGLVCFIYLFHCDFIMLCPTSLIS